MARVLTLASAKGGSGKTSLSASIAMMLGALGRRVLLVDADAATNGLTLLFLRQVVDGTSNDDRDGPRVVGMFDSHGAEPSEPAVISLGPDVDLLPATAKFDDSESGSLKAFENRLDWVRRDLGASYDVIILDAQAGADRFAAAAMSRRVSDMVVLVSEYDPMSAAGIERLKALFREDLTYERTWVALNKVLPEFAKYAGDFLEIARYLPPLPWDAEVVRAYARRRLALDLENGNTYTLAILRMVRTLFGEWIEPFADKWLSERADAIRQPIQAQYSDLEKELAGIRVATRVRESRSKQAQRIFNASMGIWIVAVLLLTVATFQSSDAFLWHITMNVAMALGVSAVLYFGYFILKIRGPYGRDAVDQELAQSRLERRRTAIESTLRQLDVLRAADPEYLFGRPVGDRGLRAE